jgi:peptidoglycan hydrolase-like protein with peptidoglycan-binding domain
MTTELSIADVQKRLQILGYDLGDELILGKYGELTAAALRAFKLRLQLPAGEILDQATWVTLVDASRMLGERVLYLHMPYLLGHDVFILQSALSAMGFSCNVDWIFGPSTEAAVRDFQRNMAIFADGIADDITATAILRLRHAWEGKLGLAGEHRFAGMRDVNILESRDICVFGTDQQTRSIADRVSNLAQAITQQTRITNASALDRPPDLSVLLVKLVIDQDSAAGDSTNHPQATLKQDSQPGKNTRLTITIAPQQKLPMPFIAEQRAAVGVLDLLYRFLQGQCQPRRIS